MNWMLIAILLALAGAMLLAAMARRDAVYEYPFFAGSVFFGFVLPQLPGLADDRVGARDLLELTQKALEQIVEWLHPRLRRAAYRASARMGASREELAYDLGVEREGELGRLGQDDAFAGLLVFGECRKAR